MDINKLLEESKYKSSNPKNDWDDLYGQTRCNNGREFRIGFSRDSADKEEIMSAHLMARVHTSEDDKSIFSQLFGWWWWKDVETTYTEKRIIRDFLKNSEQFQDYLKNKSGRALLFLNDEE